VTIGSEKLLKTCLLNQIPVYVTILQQPLLELNRSRHQMSIVPQFATAHSMNAPESSPADPKNLHLGKFTPVGQDDPPLPDDEGQTMMIRRIAAETAEKNLSEEEVHSNEFGLPVKEMLGVISHCYARGVFCSKDIASLIAQEPQLREAIGRRLPSEEVVRRFRRKFAEEIEDTLENLYRAVPQEGEKANTEVLHRQAVERVHEAAWTDNTRGRLG